jgi:O-methyltransferase
MRFSARPPASDSILRGVGAGLARRFAAHQSVATSSPPDSVPASVPVTYQADGLLTEHAADFLSDPRFVQAYDAGKATGSWWDHDLQWRAHVVCWAAQQALALDGDFVECGVHRGGYARMIVEYLDFAGHAPRLMHLIDTYCGVPERFSDALAPAVRADLAARYEECHEAVCMTFAPFANVAVVRGIVPDVLPTLDINRVAFLSIDLNAAEPSVEALRHFWPILAPGAIVLLDDYGFRHFADQKPALDSAAAQLGGAILSLPTGQGLMIRP